MKGAAHMSKLITGVTLLGWQAVAFILSATGFADAALAFWPDPAWFSLVISIVLAPPVWLAELAVGLGAALCFWALAERLQRPYTR
jgi:hypothetical protein